MRSSRAAVTVIACAALFAAAAGGAEQPDAAVRRVAAGLAAQQPQVVWEALPPSYQRDLTGLIRDFAANLDPVVHAKAVAVATKGVRVLRAQRDLILDSQTLAGLTADRARAGQGWDSAVGLVDTLLHSELADLAALRRLDPATFLRTTGSRLMQQMAGASKVSTEDPWGTAFAGQLEHLTVEVVAKEPGAATVRVTPAGKPPQELRLVEVEGRWVPAELAADWAGRMASARAQVAAMRSPESAQGTTQMLMALGMVDGLLDQLAAMKTPAELDAAAQGLLAGLTGAQPAAPTAPPAPRD